MTSPIQVYALDVLERAAKTFLQGAAGAAAPILAAVNAGNVASVAWWQQALAVAGAGGVAAIASLITSILSAKKTGTASASVAVSNSTPTGTVAGVLTDEGDLPPLTDDEADGILNQGTS